MRQPAPPTLLFRFGPALAATTVILLLSMLPARLFQNLAPSRLTTPGLDTVVHALMYALLTAAYRHALAARLRARALPVFGVATATSLFGGVMELCQRELTVSRSLSWSDVVANAVGAFACALVILLLARFNRTAPPAHPPTNDSDTPPTSCKEA